jgi:hypothetical protein
LGQKEHSNTVVTLTRQQCAVTLGFFTEEAMRDLEKYASSIAGVTLKSSASTMLEINEH